MRPKPPNFVLFPPESTPIKWRREGEGTFWFVESKEPPGFRVDCVTEDGHRANLVATTVGDRTFPAGEWFQASTRKEGETLYSRLYETAGEAKNACEHFRREGEFPSTKLNP